MPPNELRDQIIAEFKRGKLKWCWIIVVTRWVNKDPEFRYELNALATQKPSRAIH